MQDSAEDEEPERPRSPYYWALKKILDDAGVVLVPTDRDVAPYDHAEDPDESDGNVAGNSC